MVLLVRNLCSLYRGKKRNEILFFFFLICLNRVYCKVYLRVLKEFVKLLRFRNYRYFNFSLIFNFSLLIISLLVFEWIFKLKIKEKVL